jgi:hypothetical protein
MTNFYIFLYYSDELSSLSLSGGSRFGGFLFFQLFPVTAFGIGTFGGLVFLHRHQPAAFGAGFGDRLHEGGEFTVRIAAAPVKTLLFLANALYQLFAAFGHLAPVLIW